MAGRVRRLTWAAAVAVVVLTAAACVPPPLPTPSTSGIDPNTAPHASDATYTQPGPYVAGVTTLDFDGRKMEVWYPAAPSSAAGKTKDTYYIRDFLSSTLKGILNPAIKPGFETDAYRGLPVAPGGPFPLVLFSHGVESYRLQSTFLTTHLASWGFVVASPDFLERGLQSLFGDPIPGGNLNDDTVLSDTLDVIKGQDTDPTSALYGKVITSKVYPIGHSAGGFAATAFAHRPDVDSWVSLSAGIANPTFNQIPDALGDPAKSVLWMVGAQDGVVSPGSVQDAFNYTKGQRKLVVIDGAGHNNAMSDICTIGSSGGGLVSLTQQAGFQVPDFVAKLANDGCLPPALQSQTVWPVTRHFVTAELRYRAGLDPQPVGLGDGVTTQFAGVGVTYTHNP